MEFKGTKGEWAYSHLQDDDQVVCTWHVDTKTECVADVWDLNDAKLIAAAPELLKALQLMIEGSKSPDWKIEKAKKAIEKALK